MRRLRAGRQRTDIRLATCLVLVLTSACASVVGFHEQLKKPPELHFPNETASSGWMYVGKDSSGGYEFVRVQDRDKPNDAREHLALSLYRSTADPWELINLKPQTIAKQFGDEVQKACPQSTVNTIRDSDSDVIFETATGSCTARVDYDHMQVIRRFFCGQYSCAMVSYASRGDSISPAQRAEVVSLLSNFSYENAGLGSGSPPPAGAFIP